MLTKNLVGIKSGRLTVIKFSHQNSRRQSYWLCQCKCGKKKIIQGYRLSSNQTKSCGCLLKEITHKRTFVHGESSKTSGLYMVWRGIKQRCLNPKNPSYSYYGGKGITIYKKWMNYVSFKNWAIEAGYKEGLQIDRIDSKKSYYPKNCRFVNQAENKRNRSNCLKYKGECAAEASRRLGGKSCLVSGRVFRGWTIEKAFTTPSKEVTNVENKILTTAKSPLRG